MEIKNRSNKERYKKRDKNNSIRGRPVVGTGRKERGKKKNNSWELFPWKLASSLNFAIVRLLM